MSSSSEPSASGSLVSTGASGVSPTAGLLAASMASSIWRSASETPSPTVAFSSSSASACSQPSASPSPASTSGRSASLTASSYSSPA
jgi:hypothetical protein